MTRSQNNDLIYTYITLQENVAVKITNQADKKLYLFITSA